MLDNDILDGSRDAFQPFQNNNFPKDPLPNATATLVLGICSIVTFACLGGFIGLACGIVALVISKSSVALYHQNPGQYRDWPNLNAGRVCAIIGVSLSSIVVLITIFYLALIGTAISFLGR